MESPSIFEPEPIRDEIVKVFRSIRPYTVLDMDKMVVRGQYIGYREEKNVAPDSNTETYVAMKFFIDNWRWSGVPFYFYTGKKLPEKSSEVVIHFKSTPHQLFVGQCSGGSCNKLTIRIQPNESISLKFGLKMPGAGFEVKQVSMDFRYDSLSKSYLPDAYERLLLDACWAIRPCMHVATLWKPAGNLSTRSYITGKRKVLRISSSTNRDRTGHWKE